MGTLLDSLNNLQKIEHDLGRLRRRVKARENGIAAQERQIQRLNEALTSLQQQVLEKRKAADGFELELRTKDDEISRLRTALNSAKTNKEYAAILTQINTDKADNAKHEDRELVILQDIESLNKETSTIQSQIESEQEKFAQTKQTTEVETSRLRGLMEELEAKRAEATKDVPHEALAVFERIAGNYDGEAMAPIDISGKAPKQDYTCGGCYMSLTAEHINALIVHDDIRTCDNCGRILYMEKAEEDSGD